MKVGHLHHTLTERWAKIHAVTLLVATGLAYFGELMMPLVVAGMISFILLILLNRYAWVRGGAANGVTSLRLLLTFGMLACTSFLSHSVLACLGGIILLADGLDGYLARRFQTTSSFGGYYDMEADAYFVLSMSAVLYLTGLLGGWILLVGLTRYAFVLLKLFIKEKKTIHTRSSLGQFIAVFLMGSLIMGLVLPKEIYLSLILLASAMVLFSFVRELIWIIKANGSVYENA
jgi:phosphatidylglycerophosphate synthase